MYNKILIRISWEITQIQDIFDINLISGFSYLPYPDFCFDYLNDTASHCTIS